MMTFFVATGYAALQTVITFVVLYVIMLFIKTEQIIRDLSKYMLVIMSATFLGSALGYVLMP